MVEAKTTAILEQLFKRAAIPSGHAMLVHTRLRGIKQCCDGDYTSLSKQLLHQLLNCQPQLLLIPCYTIYSFLYGRVFQRELSHCEVGRFSEEIRRMGYTRTNDPMYSVLDIRDTLPDGLRYDVTFGAKTVCEHLYRANAIIVNVDMPGFYATPIHQLELDSKVGYRHLQTVQGQRQSGDKKWQTVNYQAYLRKVNGSGAAYPPYNQQRRLDYLIGCGAVHEGEYNGIRLQWARLDEFQQAIEAALKKNINFLVD